MKNNDNIMKIFACIFGAIVFIGLSVAIILKYKPTDNIDTTTNTVIDTVDMTTIATDTDVVINTTTTDIDANEPIDTSDNTTTESDITTTIENTTDNDSDVNNTASNITSAPSNNDDTPVINTTETPVVPPSNNKPDNTTETTTETPVSDNTTTETTSCNHKWDIKNDYIHHDAVYETKEVCVSEAWTEKIYEPRSFCYMCGMNLSEQFPNGNYVSHTATCNGGSNYYTETVLVDTVYHEAVYETKEVMVTPAWDEITATYRYCIYCGVEER